MPRKPLEHIVERHSAWTKGSAAGPIGAPSFETNPSFAISISGTGDAMLQFFVSSAKSAPVNVLLAPVGRHGQRVDEATGKAFMDTGDYKHGFVVSERIRVPPGTYVAVVSNYFPGQEAPFILKVMSSRVINIDEIASPNYWELPTK